MHNIVTTQLNNILLIYKGSICKYQASGCTEMAT